MNRGKALAAFVAIVAAFTISAYTTNKSAGSRKAFLNIDATGVYAFSATASTNLTSPFTANTTWSPSFVTIARKTGAGEGIFLVYSPCFKGGSDTVWAGQIIPEITDRVDSMECINLGTSTWQVEGSN